MKILEKETTTSRLTQEEALKLLSGWEVKEVVATRLNLRNGGTAFCYIVHVKDSPKSFIINADSGKVYDADEFYANHGRSSNYS